MMTGQGTQAIEAPHTGDVIKYLDVASAYGNKPAFWCRWQEPARERHPRRARPGRRTQIGPPLFIEGVISDASTPEQGLVVV